MVSSGGVETCLQLASNEGHLRPSSAQLPNLSIQSRVTHTSLFSPDQLPYHTHFCPRDCKLNRQHGAGMGKAPSQGVPMLLPLQFNKYFGHRMLCTGYKEERDQDTVTVCWGLTVRWETYSSKLPISIWSHKLNWGERRVLWECSRPPEWRSGMTSWRNGTLGELKACNNEPEEG